MSLPCSESFSSSVTGFFKVLGQLTETGVVSPEQFISEYIIVSWHFVEVAENQETVMLTAIDLAMMQRDLLCPLRQILALSFVFSCSYPEGLLGWDMFKLYTLRLSFRCVAGGSIGWWLLLAEAEVCL